MTLTQVLSIRHSARRETSGQFIDTIKRLISRREEWINVLILPRMIHDWLLEMKKPSIEK